MIKKKPKVSVVIPCYNDKDYIEETLESVLKQTFKDFEIIIVDDGSNYETKEVLKKLNFKNVNILEQENRGLSNARNNGFKKAKGEYVLTIDSDDTFDKTFLEKAVFILDKEKKVSAISSYCNIFVEDYKIIKKHIPKGGNLNNFLFDNNSTSFALIRKSVWNNIGGYDEKMIYGFEDWEFWISLTKQGGEVYIIKEFLFNYRHKKRSMSKIAKTNYREKNLSYIYKKHKDIYKEHFEEAIDFIADLAIRHKRNEIKYKTSIDFKIGRIILFPIRFAKKIILK
ncbi:glycosyltransferase family 2 protein [uncultured Polaribacter sp.]|uniref:glycosyltransferase family 2 protein n=1 Tax=uncultured Polaribacter sp. TaxID=174711 RepID=UPI0026080364|nr:glycosyltransferase family A protein [uncultured Polaribacter sp.]